MCILMAEVFMLYEQTLISFILPPISSNIELTVTSFNILIYKFDCANDRKSFPFLYFSNR